MRLVVVLVVLAVGSAAPACGGESAPPRPPPDPAGDPSLTHPPEPAPRTVDWQLTGRHRPGHLDVPALPGAAGILPAGCAEETPPCLAERWSAGADARLYVRWRQAAWLVPLPAADALPDGLPGGEDGARAARASWTTLGDLLTACLGDPLHTPPAWDPGGSRGYDGRDWILAFTGQNPCELDGTLRLRVEADRVDASKLTVGGTRWSAGGAARAESRLRARNAATGR